MEINKQLLKEISAGNSKEMRGLIETVLEIVENDFHDMYQSAKEMIQSHEDCSETDKVLTVLNCYIQMNKLDIESREEMSDIKKMSGDCIKAKNMEDYRNRFQNYRNSKSKQNLLSELLSPTTETDDVFTFLESKTIAESLSKAVETIIRYMKLERKKNFKYIPEAIKLKAALTGNFSQCNEKEIENILSQPRVKELIDYVGIKEELFYKVYNNCREENAKRIQKRVEEERKARQSVIRDKEEQFKKYGGNNEEIINKTRNFEDLQEIEAENPEVHIWYQNLMEGMEIEQIISVFLAQKKDYLLQLLYEKIKKELEVLELLLESSSKEDDKKELAKEVLLSEQFIKSLEDYFSEEEVQETSHKNELFFAKKSKDKYYFDFNFNNINHEFNKKRLWTALKVMKYCDEAYILHHSKMLTFQEAKLQDCYEYKTGDGLRILYRRITNGAYYVITAFEKKVNTSVAYRAYLYRQFYESDKDFLKLKNSYWDQEANEEVEKSKAIFSWMESKYEASEKELK